MQNSKLIFQQLFEKESSTYTYLLADSETQEGVLIDSVIETVERDLQLIKELALKIVYVLDTHIHADHVTAAGEIRKRLSVKTAVSAKANVPCVDINLKDGDELKFGRFTIRALETPGHTDACLSYACENMVFTGDALLVRGTGRTDFQGGSSERLYESITEKLFALPADTLVYPAHDYRGFTSTSIEAEKKLNPRVGAGRSKEEFVKIVSDLKLPDPKKIKEALPANKLCGLPSERKEDCRIEPQELTSVMGQSLIVDVRTPEEFFGPLGHISGAHQITLGGDLESFLKGYNRDEGIVFVCRSGRRSSEALQLVRSMGFNRLSELAGGMERWKKLKDAGELTE